MSGTRFSGIAVAAANRKALANQEREAALRDASLTHKLSSREEALLASLKSELLRGGGGGARASGGPPSKPARASAAPSTKPPSGPVKRYDTLDELEADDEEAEDEEAPGASVERGRGTPPAGGVKTYMSKAERRRLKKHRRDALVAGTTPSERRAASEKPRKRAASGASEEGPPSARAKAERVAGEGGAARIEARSSRRHSPSGSSVRRRDAPSGVDDESLERRKRRRKTKDPSGKKGAKRSRSAKSAWPPRPAASDS